jgi:RNA polymerase sigma-70 factor (ECF subfamily)
MTDLAAGADPTRSQRADDEARWAELMVRAQRGDSAGYRSLLDELADVIEAYLCRHFGALPMVEDCVQECLLALHRARHSYDPRRPFRPWFFTIVRHKTVDVLRRSATRARHEVVGAEPETHADEGVAAQGESAVEASRFLAGLSPPHREALILTKLEGRSISEAARAAGVSSAAMKSRVHRAIRLAQKMLDREAPQ